MHLSDDSGLSLRPTKRLRVLAFSFLADTTIVHSRHSRRTAWLKSFPSVHVESSCQQTSLIWKTNPIQTTSSTAVTVATLISLPFWRPAPAARGRHT
jgi:hypothetical protein